MKQLLANGFISSSISALKYLLILCIVPPLLNYGAINRELSTLSQHGLPYDIGLGQKLFLSCKGKGLPTIIMKNPIGLNSDLYIPLQEKLSTLTKTCIYDRAGLGLSERPFEPAKNESETDKAQQKAKHLRGMQFTIERMAEDLRKLISVSSQQERPIMFIGTELGAMIARFYTHIYQDNVSHLVLINPMVENLFSLETSNSIAKNEWGHFWHDQLIPKWYGYALGSIVGLNRFLMMTNLLTTHMNTSAYNESITSRQKHLMCNPKHMFSVVEEFVNLNETIAQMKLMWSIKQFPQNVSVTVVTSPADNLFYASSGYHGDDKKQLDNIWSKSLDYLKKNLHTNADYREINESIYSNEFSEPTKLFEIIKNLIIKWRSNK